MILESSFWKNDLKKNIQLLRKINTKKITDKTSFELEKIFFITAYIVRKLYQSGKLSNFIFKKNIILNCFQPIKNINRINWIFIDELYDLKNPQKCSRTLDYILNQLVHSYTFSYTFKENYKEIDMILFHSDKERNYNTYAIKLDEYIGILESVSNHDITSATMTYDEIENDYILLVEGDEFKVKNVTDIPRIDAYDAL